mmetsp:Transcript_13289/g.35620  ORF Transcript_13289/g.35620 Transcript_13289/m.35620 type:complete len:386 (-) Transcript_13289:80-1237(-)
MIGLPPVYARWQVPWLRPPLVMAMVAVTMSPVAVWSLQVPVGEAPTVASADGGARLKTPPVNLVEAWVGSDEFKDEVTVIIMNWRREKILKENILPRLATMNIVKNVLISHGRQDTFFETPNLPKVRHLKTWGAGGDNDDNAKIGLYQRFKAAQLAESDCVIWQDDDWFFNEKMIVDIYKHWREHPNVVHGIESRSLIRAPSDGRVAYTFSRGARPTTIVLTWFIAADRQLAIESLEYANNPVVHDFVAQEGKPLWNGEDIFFSLFSIYRNQKIKGYTNPQDIYPQVHREITGQEDLDNANAETAIHMQAGHLSYRCIAATFMTKFFEKLGASFSPVMRQKARHTAAFNGELGHLENWEKRIDEAAAYHQVEGTEQAAYFADVGM